VEESASQGKRSEREAIGQIYLPMVHTPHGVDGPQASGLPPKLKAQGLQEKRQQSKLRCRCILGHCSLGHHHPKQLLRGSFGHAHDNEQRRVMVRTSVHMRYIVSMCGWAIKHGTRHFNLPILPIPQLPTDLHHDLTSSHLPYQDLGNGDRQIGSLASPGETSHHSPHKNQEIQDSCEKSSSQKQDQWSNHTNLPFSGALHRLQGWLSRQNVSPTFLRSAHLGPLPSGLPK
jgi:hypothetical protein